MRLRGRLWLVVLVVCLGLMPARGEAALIDFTGELAAADDFFFKSLSITETSVLTGTIEPDFSAALTLFVADPSSPQFLYDDDLYAGGDDRGYRLLMVFQTLEFDDKITIDPFDLLIGDGTDYLLLLTQQPFLFDPATGGFDSPGDDLRRLIEACDGFVDGNLSCGDGTFTGSLTVAPASVPEPGTLSLLALGGAALVARRWRKRDES